MGAWGTSPWGISGWGIGPGEGLALVSAVPTRENVVRLEFSLPVYFSRELDPFDASHLKRYTLTPDATSRGDDGRPPRAVQPAVIEVAAVAGAGGKLLDLWTDRSFSPYPSRYTVAVNGLRATNGAFLAPGSTSLMFLGLAAGAPVPTRETLAGTGDFANPQSRLGLGDNVPMGATAILGAFPVDASGDYAVDRGLMSYRKRIVRRLTSRAFGFAHLPGYGVGAVDKVKRLDRGGEAEAMAAAAEAQIRLEPETAEVRVTLQRSASSPNLIVLRVRARTRSGERVDMGVPFSSGG